MALETILGFDWYDPTTHTTTPVSVNMLTSPTNEVAPDAWQWFTPESVPGLSAPQNFIASPGNGKLDLSWSPPLHNGDSSVSGYILRSTPHGGATTTTTLGASASTFSITGLTNGVACDVTIDAVNAFGEGPTAALTATPAASATVPGNATNLAATPGDGKVTVSWSLPGSDGGSAITGGTVRRGTQTAIAFDTTTFSHVFTGLTNGTSYSFTVKYANAIGSSTGATVSATPAVATSLAAGHIPGTVMLGVADADSTPRPGFVEARKIICFNAAGTLVRDFWLQRSFVKAPITLANIKSQMAAGDTYGQFNIISFKYLSGGDKGTQVWNQVTAGNFDSDLQILTDYAKTRRGLTTGVNPYFSAGIHHEPVGDEAGGVIADWAAMHIYCSYFFAGYRRASPTSAYVYHADQDVRDILAWGCIFNGSAFVNTAKGKSDVANGLPDELVATFKAHSHVVAADFYEPTANISNAADYAADNWVPNRPQHVEDRLTKFFSNMKGRPGGCGALGIGEYNSVDANAVNTCYSILKANSDVAMFANFFISAQGSKWDWRCIPNSYPMISQVSFTDYPPGHEVGGTWMTEQRLNVFKRNLDDSLGKDSTDASRMTQWTSWPSP